MIYALNLISVIHTASLIDYSVLSVWMSIEWTSSKLSPWVIMCMSDTVLCFFVAVYRVCVCPHPGKAWVWCCVGKLSLYWGGINYLSKVESLSAFGYSHALIIKHHHLASCFVGHMLFVPRALWLPHCASLWQSKPSSQPFGTPCAVEWLIALRREDRSIDGFSMTLSNPSTLFPIHFKIQRMGTGRLNSRTCQ